MSDHFPDAKKKARRRHAVTHIPPLSRSTVRVPRFQVGDDICVGGCNRRYKVVAISGDTVKIKPPAYWLGSRHDDCARSVLMACCRAWKGDE